MIVVDGAMAVAGWNLWDQDLIKTAGGDGLSCHMVVKPPMHCTGLGHCKCVTFASSGLL